MIAKAIREDFVRKKAAHHSTGEGLWQVQARAIDSAAGGRFAESGAANNQHDLTFGGMCFVMRQ
jgi:hypothetical protein